MNRIIKYICIILLFTSVALAQHQGGGGGGNHGGNRPDRKSDDNKSKKSAKIGLITGKVIDSETDKPIHYAVVSVINPEDTTIVTGGITDSDGDFKIKDIPPGRYIVRVKFMGYRSTRNDSLRINPKNSYKDFGVIKMHTDPILMNEVLVTAKRDAIVNSIDKRTINVDETILTISRSATEVLQQIPSISVDMNGVINLRGSGNVTVLIDGRQSALTGASRQAVLDNIPASQIDKIEVITNPSAKYDAEGMSGIINIIMKKNDDVGANGAVNLSGSTHNKYNTNFNGNIKYRNFNIYGNYGFRYEDNNSSSSSLNKVYHTKSDSLGNTYQDTTVSNQSGRGYNLNRYHSLFGGIDYNIDDNNTLSLTTSFSRPIGNNYNTTIFNTDNLYTQNMFGYTNNQNSSSQRRSSEVSLNYKLIIAPKHELTANASYSSNHNDGIDNFSKFIDDPNFIIGKENQDNLTNNSFLILQTDYSLPLSIYSTFEAGYKSTFRKYDNNFNYNNYSFDDTTSTWNLISSKPNHFLFNENIHALYATVQGLVDNFGYKLGLRFEQTVYDGNQLYMPANSGKFKNNYHDLFPSMFVNYKPTMEDQFRLSYSMRINRPNMNELNPLVDRSNPNNLSMGNPNLKPEYTHSLEFTYSREMTWLTLNSSIYYRRTNDLVNRITYPISVDTFIVTYGNFNSRTNMGLEMIGRLDLWRWWNATLTFNAFNSRIIGTIDSNLYNNSRYSYMFQFMSNMDIPDIIQFQLSGNYMAPQATPQGTNKSIMSINLGLKKSFFENQLSVTLNGSDVFNTRKFQVDMSGIDFWRESMRKRESQIFSLTLSWRFGTQFDEDSRPKRRASDFVPTETFDAF